MGDDPPKIRLIHEAVVAKFPVLREWGNDGLSWANLQFAESQAMLSAMLMLMTVHKVPSFPVHDSLIVRSKDAKVTEEMLQRCFLLSLGVEVEVSAKQQASVLDEALSDYLIDEEEG